MVRMKMTMLSAGKDQGKIVVEWSSYIESYRRYQDCMMYVCMDGYLFDGWWAKIGKMIKSGLSDFHLLGWAAHMLALIFKTDEGVLSLAFYKSGFILSMICFLFGVYHLFPEIKFVSLVGVLHSTSGKTLHFSHEIGIKGLGGLWLPFPLRFWNNCIGLLKLLLLGGVLRVLWMLWLVSWLFEL